MCIGHHVVCPLFLSDFNKTWSFSTDFLKNRHVRLYENRHVRLYENRHVRLYEK